MDIVEMVLWERPSLVDIVDLEAEIRRNESWLDWGNIHTRYLGGRVLIREITSPLLASG